MLFDGEICEYYAWFLKKRYHISLIKPIRNAHVSFINDSVNDIKNGLQVYDIDPYWNKLKEKYDNKEIDIKLNLDVRSNSKHWWLNVHNDSRIILNEIRKEIKLSNPFFGLHLSIGLVNEKYLDHSKYIVDLCSKYGNEYN